MLNNELSREYALILAKYLKKFKLESVDIAYLINNTRTTIDGLLKGEKTVVLNTLEQIAQCFGLRYFEFGNPKNPIPSLQDLPKKTQDRIEYRKREGLSQKTTHTKRDINAQIRYVLTQYKLNDKFLIEDVQKAILKEFQIKYHISEIMDRIRKSFSPYLLKTEEKFVEKVGRGAKPNYMKVVKELPRY